MTQPTSMSDSGSGRAAQSMTPALLLGMAGFLTNFDVTAVVIALPAVARELGLDIAGYAWVMDAYSLAFTACLLFAGALADRYGRRRAMLVGNGIFALASLACGMAWDGPTLLAARALQGIGAAFIVTGGFALIAYPAEYDNSGIKTFMVNQDGVVYEKDLGLNTARIASGIVAFNPDQGWEKVVNNGIPQSAAKP